MTEGRKSQVVLLDERRLDIFIQPRLYAGELLDLVASHFHLREKEYFGIAYLNDTAQYWSWLQLDKRVLEHDLPKKSTNSLLTLHFRVKYFVESITQLKEPATAEAFYLQARSLLSKGELEADSDTVVQLAGLVLQATYGDFVDESMFRSQLRRLPVLPTSTLKEHSSISNCEEKVLKHYKSLGGQSRGSCIINYLSIVESLPTYGQHYYEIKDKTGSPCWLGLSYKGISQYDKSDRSVPQKVFLWKQLENLYYRDRKFTIEVHEARRVVHTLSSFNLYEGAIEEPVEEYDDLSNAICDPTTQVSVSRRTLAPANVTVYVWYASSPVVTKCIWSMAIAQHHFFLDRRHRKSQTNTEPNLRQLASELCQSVQSLSSIGSHSNLSRTNSSSSLPSTIFGGEISEESKAATIEMLSALQARKDALQEALKEKTNELRALCLKEGDLTGELPPETPLVPGEAQPQVRRRVGTAFSLSDKFICKSRGQERESLNDLELEYEIQSKIASAAYQLANDCTVRKSVRKQRKVSYVQATVKLRTIEEKLSTLRREKDSQGDCSAGASEKDALDDSGVNLSGSVPESSLSPQSAGESSSTFTSYLGDACVPQSAPLPHLTVTNADCLTENASKCRQRHQSLQHMQSYSGGLDNEPCEHFTWSVSSYWAGEMEYDSVSCNSGNIRPSRVPYRNKFESRLDIEGSNLYSVPNRRASQVFDSQDDLILGGKKADYDKRSPLHKVSPGLSSSVPLSSSYDERMWFDKSKNLATISSECSSLEHSFEAQSNFSGDSASLHRFESSTNHQRKLPNESSESSVKLTYFHSENALNQDDQSGRRFHCESPHVSEPNLMKSNRVVHGHSVPHLHRELPSKPVPEPQAPRSHAISSHSINQFADLVQASMLLQGSKRALSASSIGRISPKTKTKEWIETSLDSPIPVRKSKSKQPSDDVNGNQIQNRTVKNLCEPQVFRLSPYPKNQYSSGTANCFSNKRHAIHSSHVAQSARDQGHRYDSRPSSVNLWSNADTTDGEGLAVAQPEELPHLPQKHMTCEPYPCKPAIDNASFVYREFSSTSDLAMLQSHEQNFPQRDSVDLDYSQTLPYRKSPFPSDSSMLHCDKPQYSNYPSPAVHSRYVGQTYDSDNNVNQSAFTSVPSKAQPQQYCPSPSPYTLEPIYSNRTNVDCDSPIPSTNVFPIPIVCNQNSNDINVCYSPNSHYQEPVTNIPQETVPPCATPTNFSSTYPTTDTLPSSPTNFAYPSNVEVNVVSVGHFQPYWEETKPYELSDFYKYSTKHRKPQPQYGARRDSISESESHHTLAPEGNSRRNVVSLPPCRVVSPIFHNRPPSRTAWDPVMSNEKLADFKQKLPTSNQEIMVNAQFAVIQDPNQGQFSNNLIHEEPSNARVKSPTDANSSFGDMGIGFSLADNFHDEMLAWYDNREAVKKATLV